MTAQAKLKLSVSPRKTRLVVDAIRGVNADKALQILQVTPKGSAKAIAKLLQSAIANYQSKEGASDAHATELFVKEAFVDSAGMLKRMRPVAKGMSHRIRKRKSRITLVVGAQPSQEGQKKTKKQPQTTTKS